MVRGGVVGNDREALYSFLRQKVELPRGVALILWTICVVQALLGIYTLVGWAS